MASGFFSRKYVRNARVPEVVSWPAIMKVTIYPRLSGVETYQQETDVTGDVVFGKTLASLRILGVKHAVH
jgi:hypothetical protein